MSILSLNPCCNGRWSRTAFHNESICSLRVLILVVMEDGLVHIYDNINDYEYP